MAENRIDCWNCDASLILKPGESLKNDATCPDCGEYLTEDLLESDPAQDGFDEAGRNLNPSSRHGEKANDWEIEEELIDSVFNIHADRAARRRSRKSRLPVANSRLILVLSITTAFVVLFGVSVYFLINKVDALIASQPPAPPSKQQESFKAAKTPNIRIEPDLSQVQKSLAELRKKQFQQLNKDIAKMLASNGGASDIELPAIEPTQIPSAEMLFDRISDPQKPTVTPIPIVKKKNNNANTDARFTFTDGNTYKVKFEVKAEFENRTEITSGTTTYEVRGRNKQQSVVSNSREGSGTAFVVANDGTLVTCAHVVENAEEIEVHLGKKTYAAEVIAIDESTDLAILQIKGKNLKPLPLADSDSALLGQDVRAVGYPLSDVLGTDVKVTRGTISGILQRDGQKQLQIDAAVNPGNSGGPVVNSRGEVVGVASAKLNGMEIQRVGFCVPANPVREFLKKNGLKPDESKTNVELEGPDLVAAVTPSVAFIKVKSGAGANSKHSELNFNSQFHKMIKNASGRTIPSLRYRRGSLGIGRGTLLLTHRGEIVRSSEEEQLPFLIGPPSQLPLLEFRKGKRRQWTTKRETSLVQERPETTTSGVPLPRYIDPFGRRRNSEVVKVLPAVEIQTYEIKSEDDQKVVIGLDYNFYTTVSDNGQVIKLVGEGEYQFNKNRGFTSKYEFDGTYLVESEQVTLKVPLTVTASLLSRQEVEAEKDRSSKEQAQEAARPSAVNSMGTAPRLDYPVQQQISEMGWGVKSLTFSPDASFVAAGKADDFVEIYDVETGRKVFTEGRLREIGNISAITFSPDGQYLLAGGFKGIIKIWEVAENGLLTPYGEFNGHSREVSSINVSPDGKHVLSGGAEKQVRCWTFETQKEKFISDPFDYGKIGIHFLDENQALISDGRVLRKLNLKSGEAEKTFELRNTGSANNVFFSPDGEIVSVTDGYSLKMWSTIDGQELPELKGKEMLWDADFSSDGKRIIAGGRGHLVVWDLEKQDRVGHVLLGDSIMYVKPLDVSNDGNYVACYPSAAGQSLWIFKLEEE